MISDYFMLAVRNISRRKLRSWLTMIGIFIGIIAVVSLIALGNGVRAAIFSQFNSMGSNRLVVQSANTGFGPPGSTAVNPLTNHDVDIIERVPGVDGTATRLIRVAKVEFNDELKFRFIASIPDNNDALKLVEESASLEASSGRLLTKDDTYKVVVGSSYADKAIYSRKLKVGDKLKINGKNFEIVGVAKDSGYPQQNMAILMPEQTMRELLSIEEQTDLIVAQVTDEKDIQNVAERIKRDIRKDRGQNKGEEDFEVQSPAQMLKSLDSILGIMQAVIIGIAAISLLVGGIGIMNTMYTSVLERSKEIGIMKAVGATNNDIMFVFLFESGILGLVGGAIGLILGIAVSEAASIIAREALGISTLKPEYSFFLLAGALTFSFIIGVVSGLLPAMSAAKLPAVDSLRGSKL